MLMIRDIRKDDYIAIDRLLLQLLPDGRNCFFIWNIICPGNLLKVL